MGRKRQKGHSGFFGKCPSKCGSSEYEESFNFFDTFCSFFFLSIGGVGTAESLTSVNGF